MVLDRRYDPRRLREAADYDDAIKAMMSRGLCVRRWFFVLLTLLGHSSVILDG